MDRSFRRKLSLVQCNADLEGYGALWRGRARGDRPRLREAPGPAKRSEGLARRVARDGRAAREPRGCGAGQRHKTSAGDYYLRAGIYHYNA
jgi:hypothetical protein